MSKIYRDIEFEVVRIKTENDSPWKWAALRNPNQQRLSPYFCVVEKTAADAFNRAKDAIDFYLERNDS